MPLIVGLGTCIALFATYLAVMTTFALVRDDTLSSVGRLARIVLAWLVPFVAPLFMLRSIAEVSPKALPPASLLRPARWLLKVRARKGNDLAAHDDSPDSWPGGHDGGS